VIIHPLEENRQQLAKMKRDREREFFNAVCSLSKQHPLVIVIDNLNSLEDEIEKWICNTLLAQIEQIPNLAIIIAGHRMPKPSHLWEECCQRATLEPIANVDVWVDWVGKHGLSLTREQVEPLVFYLKGQPKQMAESLLAFAKEKALGAQR